MKLLFLYLIVIFFVGCGGSNKATNGNKLVALYEKVHKDFDNYLLIGNVYTKIGNRDSAMYYGGKINATYKTLDDIYKIMNK